MSKIVFISLYNVVCQYGNEFCGHSYVIMTISGMLWKLDESVGQVVEALRANQMLHNSVILFSTDNGGPAAGFNDNAASNWPLRGVGGTVTVPIMLHEWNPSLWGNIFCVIQKQ